MATYTWTSGVNGDWTIAADWTPATVPNGIDADVVIDATTTLVNGYTVTLAIGNTETISSLTLNGDNNLEATNTPTYNAAEFELDGTLQFAPGSAGSIGGSLQTYIHTGAGSNAELINAGTINGFIQVEGNLLLTGTNGVYITNWLQALAGTVTVDTKSIAEMDAANNVLFDGIFDAKGPGAVINLGGPLQDLIVNIETIEGPPLVPGGWTEVLFNDPTAVVQEWDGGKYVSLESTLKRIGDHGTVDVLVNSNYSTTNTLTVDTGGLFNLQAGTVTAAGIVLNGGLIEGYAEIDSNVVNNGTIIPVGGTIDINGSLTGTGLVALDQGGTTASTVELNAVSAGQTIVMDGNDTLRLMTPDSFAGTIEAKPGDQIILQGVTATSAVLNNGTLIVSNGTTTVDRLTIGGTTTNESFNVSGSIVTVGTAAPPPPPADNFTVLDTTTGITTTSPGDAYNGPVAGLDWQYINITTDSLNITATAPNAFLRSGSGMDGLNVSQSNGNNILDGGTGSNFLTGGTGNDTFYLDDRNPDSPIWSTIVNFHSGDDATIWGVNQTDFTMLTLDGQGAPGFTGVDLIFSKDGQPPVSFTIAGWDSADLNSSKVSMSWGKTADLPGLPGSEYLTIHAN
jgi:hypothetical protein